MALSFELKRRLDSVNEPLSKRLKLAEKTYCSSDLMITRKEDLILKWLCKVALTDSVVWQTLNLCVCSQNVQSRTAIDHKTRKTLVTTLIKKLKSLRDDITEDVLECCNWVLADPGMKHYFQSLLHIFGRFLNALLVRVKLDNSKCIATNDNESSEKTVTLLDTRHICIKNAIDSIVQMHKQSSEKDVVAATFLEYVLSPLCALVDPNRKDSSNRIGAEAYKCMQQILFGKLRYTEYKEYSQGNVEVYLPAKLFSTINQLINDTAAADVPGMLSCVFCAAIGSYKTDSALIDSLFRNFVNAASNLKTIVSNSLMTHLTDVHLEFDNKIDDLTLTEYFNNLIDITLRKEHLSNEDYNLLHNITSLNPLIIENKILVILKQILLRDRSTESEEQSYITLVISILDASSRLRREQKFIPWLLMGLNEALTENKNCSLPATKIFPLGFTSKFTAVISTLQNVQTTAMLKSLTFHLRSNCVDEYTENSTNEIFLMAQCTVQLLIAFLNGIRIFEHSVPIAIQQKFTNAFGELGVVLSALNTKILNTKYNRKMMIVLLEATLSWSQVQCLLIQYAPKSGVKNLPFPISDDDLQGVIKRIEDFGDMDCKRTLNKFLCHRLNIDLACKLQSELTDVITALEIAWPIILINHPVLILLLSADQLAKLASLILGDMINNESNVEKWCAILERENLQENKKLVTAILCQALIKIGSVRKESKSATITSCIDITKILEIEKDDDNVPVLSRKKLIRVIPTLSVLNENDSCSIQKYLRTLLCAPLRNLCVPLRTMTFVIIYVISRECECDEKIKTLCNNILSETLEEGGLKISKYIDFASLVPILPTNKILQKVFEMSIRNFEPTSSLMNMVNFDECPDEAVPVVLSCIENVKSKLNNEQKVALSEVEKKLGKRALGMFKKNIESSEKIRSITAALKVALGRKKVNDKLKNSVRTILETTFTKNSMDENQNLNDKEEIILAALELAVLALEHRTYIDFSEKLIADIWKVVLKYPQTKLLTPLLDASVPKVFDDLLISLHNEMKTELQNTDSIKSNGLVIWDHIVKSNMGAPRNNSRLSASRQLLQMFQMSEIKAERWPDLIKLLQAMVNSKHMQLSSGYIDMIIMVAAKSLREGNNLVVCDNVLVLCLGLLRSRIEMMMDRLPVLLKLYRCTINLLMRESKKENMTDSHLLATCALNIETLTGALVKLKKHMVRLSPYVISDVVNVFSEGDLQPIVKELLKNCVNNFLSICDSHGVELILRNFSSAKREIFREMNDAYNKFHRFTGKI